MAWNAEGGAGASRESGAEEGRAFLIVVVAASAAPPAWPIEAAVISFLSIEILVVVAAVSITASGTIFTVMYRCFCVEASGRSSFLALRGKKEGRGAGELTFCSFVFLSARKVSEGSVRSRFFFPASGP